jgi:hypothetical protein
LDASVLSLGSLNLVVTLKQEKLSSPWQAYKWVVDEVLPWNGESAIPDALAKVHAKRLTVHVFQDAMQGYFLNLDAPEPKIFVCVRAKDSWEDVPEIFSATLSYEEAASWMDSSEDVQSVPMPLPIAHWLAELVSEKFQLEPKKRRRPQSFIKPELRGGTS